MTDCTCSNCIFMGDGFRYCYDCEKYIKMPSREEFERKIAEAGEQLPSTVFVPVKDKGEIQDA